MNIKQFETEELAASYAFDRIAANLDNGAKVFGLATGSTPLSLYRKLSQSSLDFSRTTSVNLDEYYGLAANHPQSYHQYMEQNLFQYKPFENSYLPNGTNLEVNSEIQRYNRILSEHPIDLQILGIGRNGHIGFNEPGSDFTAHTQLVNLTESTIQANQRFFESADQVPTKAYSMGIASIMAAKEIILLAFGTDKAQAVRDMIQGPVSEDLPASILQKHPNVTILLDKAAASLLN